MSYEELPESEKQYDRNTAMETLKAILALGYQIKSDSPNDSSSSLSNSLEEPRLGDEERLEAILRELSAPGNEVLHLLQAHPFEASELWRRDVRLWRAFGKALLAAGYPAKAFELVREGLQCHARDLDLRYLSALALARGGNISQATEQIQNLLQEPDLSGKLKIEALSLAGRLAKDKYQRANKTALKIKLAREAANLYAAAHELSSTSFPGINAATMSLLSGQRKRARQLAAIVIEQATEELAQAGTEDSHWLFATLGEAHVIQGEAAEAISCYRKAVHNAAGKSGDIASMRRNALLLKDKLKLSEQVLEVLNPGCVVVFSGHMIDYPDQASQHKLPERFPPAQELEERVRLAIRESLEKLGATIGYSSVACGSDILFAEEMLARRAEVHIVLPFDRSDFYLTSVDFGRDEMSHWRNRCDAVLARATEVHYATKENFLGDPVLFQFVNTFTQGLAVTRAAELGIEPHGLVVLEPSSRKLTGGTAYFLEKWTSGGRKAHVIDLAAARASVSINLPAAWGEGKSKAPVTQGDIRRKVKAMLFADVKNFSKLREEQAPSFFSSFLDQVARVINGLKKKPAFSNTWGDGLYLVFDNVLDCAVFAMELLDRIEKTNWEKVGLPSDTTVRMGIHAGPVYPRMDKIIQRKNFFGSHVNRAARIEPVTTPGSAFTTEQFAAALAMEPNHDFVCEYVGVEDLAKGYDRIPLYRLGRK